METGTPWSSAPVVRCPRREASVEEGSLVEARRPFRAASAARLLILPRLAGDIGGLVVPAAIFGRRSRGDRSANRAAPFRERVGVLNEHERERAGKRCTDPRLGKSRTASRDFTRDYL